MDELLLIGRIVAGLVAVGLVTFVLLRQRGAAGLRLPFGMGRFGGTGAAATECPHLGLASDPFTRDARASDEHRCYANLGHERIDLAHQRRFCLASAHNRCPFLTVRPHTPGRGAVLAQARAWWRSVSPAHPVLTAAQLGQSAGLGAAGARGVLQQGLGLVLALAARLAMLILQTWQTAGPHAQPTTRLIEDAPVTLTEADSPIIVTGYEATPADHAEPVRPVAVLLALATSGKSIANLQGDSSSSSLHRDSVSHFQGDSSSSSLHRDSVSHFQGDSSSSGLHRDSVSHFHGDSSSSSLNGDSSFPVLGGSERSEREIHSRPWSAREEGPDAVLASIGTPHAELERGIAAVETGSDLEGYAWFARATEREPSSVRAWFWRAKTAETLDEVVDCLARAHALEPGNTLIASNLDWATARRDASRQAAKSKPRGTPAAAEPPPFTRPPGPGLVSRFAHMLLELCRASAALGAFALGAAWLLSALPIQTRAAVMVAAGLPEGLRLPDADRLINMVHVPLGGGYDLGMALPYGIGFLALGVGFGLVYREGWSRLWAPALAVASAWLIAG